MQVLTGHVQWVYCCSISPDCSMLCSAAGEKSVSPTGWSQSCVPLNPAFPMQEGEGESQPWERSQLQLPCAPQALLWSMRSYTLIRKLEGHQSSVVSCDFSPDSALLVTASYDTCVIMWDPYTGEQLRTLRYGAGGCGDQAVGTQRCYESLVELSEALMLSLFSSLQPCPLALSTGV